MTDRPEMQFPYVLRFECVDPLDRQDIEWACADFELDLTREGHLLAVTLKTVKDAFRLGCCVGGGYMERRRRREWKAEANLSDQSSRNAIQPRKKLPMLSEPTLDRLFRILRRTNHDDGDN